MSDILQWNPWHGCHKISPGCLNCYMYQQDRYYGVQSNSVRKVKTKFDTPIKKDRKGVYKIPSETILPTCFTSDFFIEDADAWRQEVYDIMAQRQDLQYFIITKRAIRIKECLPPMQELRDNLLINVTGETQEFVDMRVRELLECKLKYNGIVLAPMLERIDLRKWLATGRISSVSVGGESAPKTHARPLYFEWVLDIQRQCKQYQVDFTFYQTGTRFVKDNKLYIIAKDKEKEQALKANLNLNFKRVKLEGDKLE